MSAPQISHMRAGLERRMTFRSTIQRNMATGTDPLGNPAPPDWQDLATDVPCYAWQGAGKGETRTVDVLATLDQWSLVLPADTDLTEADRITAITDVSGVQWNTAPLNIQGVDRRQTHILAVGQEAR